MNIVLGLLILYIWSMSFFVYGQEQEKYHAAAPWLTSLLFSGVVIGMAKLAEWLVA